MLALMLAAAATVGYVGAAATPYIDSHTHFDAKNPQASVRAALAGEAAQGAMMIFFLPPPDTFASPNRVDAEAILPAAKQRPESLRVLGGGGTLNVMIQRGDTDLKAFEARAEALIAEGVVGFGEMTAEHFAGGTPYQSVPPDHPLFLLLADIAARHAKPIVLHLEAVPEDMPLPSGLKSPPNPPTLHENIRAFERLLSHDVRAKIVWAHLGTDGTGARTPTLCRRLLAAHPNLFMEIKTNGKGQNAILENGKVGPAWLQLFRDFPDRFLIGSDQHYPDNGQEPRWQGPVTVLNQLPKDLQIAIGRDNAMKIYGMSYTVLFRPPHPSEKK